MVILITHNTIHTRRMHRNPSLPCTSGLPESQIAVHLQLTWHYITPFSTFSVRQGNSFSFKASLFPADDQHSWYQVISYPDVCLRRKHLVELTPLCCVSHSWHIKTDFTRCFRRKVRRSGYEIRVPEARVKLSGACIVPDNIYRYPALYTFPTEQGTSKQTSLVPSSFLGKLSIKSPYKSP